MIAPLSAALASVSGVTGPFSWVWVSLCFFTFFLWGMGVWAVIPIFGFWVIGFMGGYAFIIFSYLLFPGVGGNNE